jgi:hypothetical protein
MAVQASAVSVRALMPEAQVSPAPADVTDEAAGPEPAVLCPFLDSPCKKVPKQPGFRTCVDCTIYKVWHTADRVDRRFWY